MEENFVVGIEGLVGAGKTSICKQLLNKSGFIKKLLAQS